MCQTNMFHLGLNTLLAQTTSKKNKIMSSFNKAKIPVMVYYKIPLHLQKCNKSLKIQK